MTTLVERLLTPSLTSLVLENAGARKVWLVGGALRDHFLDRPHPDLDFAVGGNANGLARSVAAALGAAYFVLDRDRDAARVILADGRTLDFVQLRGQSIEEDLRLRDFTMNALAVSLEQPKRLIDELGGLQDLRDKLLRVCSPRSIEQDPLRALRAVRLASALVLHIEPQTADQIRRAASHVRDTPAERMRDELAHMLNPPATSTSTRLMVRLGLLGEVLPEIGSVKPELLERTLQVADRLAEILGALEGSFREERASNLALAEVSLRLGRYRERLSEHLRRRLRGGRSVTQLLMLATLFHALPGTEGGNVLYARCLALRFSLKEAARAQSIVSVQPTVEGVKSRIQLHRYFRAAGDAGVDAALLSLAVVQVRRPQQELWQQKVSAVRGVLEAWFDNYEEIVQPPPMLRGNELADALHLAPGPILGELLTRISEAQVQGAVASKAEAVEFARSQMLELEGGEVRERSR